MQVIDLHLYLNDTIAEVFFTHFASNDQLPGFSMLRTLAGKRLITVTYRRNIIWVNELNQVFNGLRNTKPLVSISTDQMLIYENFTGFISNFWMCLQLHDAVIICTVAICWCFSKIDDVCYIDPEKRDMIKNGATRFLTRWYMQVFPTKTGWWDGFCPAFLSKELRKS